MINWAVSICPLFKRNGEWIGEEIEHFVLPAITKKIRNQHEYKATYIEHDKKLKMDDWLEFLGYFISEGSACIGFADKNKKYVNYRVTISQNNDEKREKIKQCLDRLGFHYVENDKNNHSKNLELRNKQLYSYLKTLGHSEDRFIDYEFKFLSSHQLKILLIISKHIITKLTQDLNNGHSIDFTDLLKTLLNVGLI